jgi:hypothetical protein
MSGGSNAPVSFDLVNYLFVSCSQVYAIDCN